MDDPDEVLRQARERYLAEDDKYEQRYVQTGKAIVDDFLEKLEVRMEAQSDLLRQLTEEARQEITGFTNVRVEFAVQLANIFLSLQGGLASAQLRVIEQGLKLDARAVQATGAQVTVALARATLRAAEALNGAAGLIAMRRATLEQFRRAHLLATWEQVRERLEQGVSEELMDAFSGEMAAQVVELLIKHGGEAGKAVAGQVPVFGTAAKLAILFYDVTRAPEKHATVGGADLLLVLVSAMRKEREMYEKFLAELREASAAVNPAI